MDVTGSEDARHTGFQEYGFTSLEAGHLLAIIHQVEGGIARI